MKPTASIIVPTWNNAEYFNPCVESILQTGVLTGLCELIVVNNGTQPIKEMLKSWPNTTVIEPGINLGWEKGLLAGIEVAQGDFYCFQNDDTLIPKATQSFYSQLLWPFHNKDVAAVGPATTVAAGWHSIFRPNAFRTISEVSFLIFFTAMIRKEHFEAAGGIDDSCPGGDDIDLSIRLRKLGKKILVNPDAFLIHHAFKTGERVHGTPDQAHGWNSKEMSDRTNRWLIQKHGFQTFLETMRGLQPQYSQPPDLEAEVVGSFVRGEKIVELGCGGRKTVPQAIGMDFAAKGEPCGNIDHLSVADVQGDVMQPLPFQNVDTIIARHILEHSVDPVDTLRNWRAALSTHGRLVIAVPDEDIRRTIPLNPEHRHGFTPASLKNLLEVCGFRVTDGADTGNGISFVMVCEPAERLVEPIPTFPEAVHA